jgi:hypothetical protein
MLTTAGISALVIVAVRGWRSSVRSTRERPSA